MMKLIQGNDAAAHPDLIDQMYQLRARVFSDRLGWDVKVKDGWEKDRFDDLNPLYALSLDDQGKVVGSFRLLQTTGPTMLADVFSACLPEGVDIRSPIIWESTRFCVDKDLAKKYGPRFSNQVTAELLSSILEIGQYAGLSHVVTVIDVRMERILLRANCPVDRLKEPVDIGGVPTLAILMECSENWISSVQNKGKISEACISHAEFSQLYAA